MRCFFKNKIAKVGKTLLPAVLLIVSALSAPLLAEKSADITPQRQSFWGGFARLKIQLVKKSQLEGSKLVAHWQEWRSVYKENPPKIERFFPQISLKLTPKSTIKSIPKPPKDSINRIYLTSSPVKSLPAIPFFLPGWDIPHQRESFRVGRGFSDFTGLLSFAGKATLKNLGKMAAEKLSYRAKSYLSSEASRSKALPNERFYDLSLRGSGDGSKIIVFTAPQVSAQWGMAGSIMLATSSLPKLTQPFKTTSLPAQVVPPLPVFWYDSGKSHNLMRLKDHPTVYMGQNIAKGGLPYIVPNIVMHFTKTIQFDNTFQKQISCHADKFAYRNGMTRS